MTPQTTTAGLQAALAAEHRAVYGYGVLGARLTGARQESARTLWEAHKAQRDRLFGYLEALRADPVAAAPAYRLPIRPTSASTAAQLAAALDDETIGAYVGLAGADDPQLRRFAALAMQEAVARAVRWRGTGPSGAFPGLPANALQPEPGQ